MSEPVEHTAGTDITARLSTWCHAPQAESAQDLMDEAAKEIERLRGYRDMAEADRDVAMLAAERLRREAPCPYVVGKTTLYCSLPSVSQRPQAGESNAPALTDEERRVLRDLRDSYAAEDDQECNQIAKVLDGLLERTRPDA